MNGREIPGFYFDAVKGKYFRVQPGHVANGNEYTQQNVKKLHGQQLKRRRVENYNRQIQQERLTKSRVHNHPLLARESWGGTRNQLPKLFADGLGINLKDSTALEQGERITALQWDRGKNSLVVATSNLRTEVSTVSILQLPSPFPPANDLSNTCELSTPAYMSERRYAPWTGLGNVNSRLLNRSPSLCTSLSINHTGNVGVATYLGNDLAPATVDVFALPDRDLDPSDHEGWMSLNVCHGRGLSDGAAWSSAANPWKDLVAIGTDRNTQLIATDNSVSPMRDVLDSTGGDVKAVGWLTGSVVASGERNGNIALWDVRTKGSSLRLCHPGSLSNLAAVDEHQLIAHGCESGLCLYDLRMPAFLKGNSLNGSRGKADVRRNVSGKGPYRKDRFHSHPVVEYGYTGHLGWPGFDINVALGIVAAVDESCMARIYNLATGELLRSWSLINADGKINPDQFSTLKFVETETGDALLAGQGGQLSCLCW